MNSGRRAASPTASCPFRRKSQKLRRRHVKRFNNSADDLQAGVKGALFKLARIASGSAQHREREARPVTGDAVSAMIAHEVKQPPTAMIMRAETSLRRLNQSIPDLEKAKEEIKQISSDGYRAAAVIDNILANFNKDARERTSVDVNVLIDETVDLVRSDPQKYRIVLGSEPGAGPPQVAADRRQLQQVLLNLITNATDAMKANDGARVLRLASEVHDNGNVVVSVADTGTGINSQDVERIFNPLFTTKSDGMGMGLSICGSIIEGHGGQMSVVPNKSNGPIFELKLAADLPTTTATSAASQSC
jgi:signal transduction histidine kinase